MPAWQTASAVFFVYLGIVAALLPRLTAERRRLACTGAIIGVIVVAGARTSPHKILDDWIVPPALLLLGYWTSGLLFVAPMPHAERPLLALDRILRVRRIAASLPQPVTEGLEVAYMAVYPVVPIALAVHLTRTPDPDAGRFWSVILITDYVCFGMLPWVQTRPPRAIEREPPWRSSFRRLNLRLLGEASIHANTFPSGHAAEALAAALMVAGAGPLPVAGMFLMALAISSGAVLGRYHYAADALAGWMVALAVWWLM